MILILLSQTTLPVLPKNMKFVGPQDTLRIHKAQMQDKTYIYIYISSTKFCEIFILTSVVRKTK